MYAHIDSRKSSPYIESLLTRLSAITIYIVSAGILAQNKNGVQQGGNTVGVALSCKCFWSMALCRPKIIRFVQKFMIELCLFT